MSNYVKKYDLGEMYLNLPYANCIHELPLLSFSDMKSNVTLSLVFNESLKPIGGIHVFNIAAGYKLNLEKRIVVASDGNATFFESNGKRVTLNRMEIVNDYEQYTYTFPDDSGRIIRPTSTGKYILEYPDYSKEHYHENGRIQSIENKYGEILINFSYENDLLTMITYRPQDLFPIKKQIVLSYTENGKLEYIKLKASVSNEFAASIHFIYSPPQYVYVQHYSGVEYSLFSDTLQYSATVISDNGQCTKKYSKSGQQAQIVEYEGNSEISRFSYAFPSSNNCPQAPFSYVDVTDNLGVKTRIQFNGEKLLYSYEIGEDGPVFLSNGKFAGNVQVYHAEGSSINSKTSYVQHVDSGEVMAKTESESYWNWENVPGSAEGFHIISGWVKYKNNDAGNHRATTDLWTFDTLERANYFAGGIVAEQWMYFAFALISDSTLVRFAFDYPNEVEVRDIRIMFQPTVVKKTEARDQGIHVIEDILIEKSDADDGYKIENIIPIKNLVFSCNGNDISNVTFEDLLRYKINQEKGVHPSEFYSNANQAIYTIPQNQDITFSHNLKFYNLDNFYLGKRQNTAEGSLVTCIKGREGTNLLVVDTIEVKLLTSILSWDFVKYTLKKQQLISQHLDVSTVIEDAISISCTRTNGLLISTTVYPEAGDSYGTSIFRDEEAGTMVTTDEFGNQTTYTIDKVWGGVTKIELPDGSVIENTYDSDGCALVRKAFGGAQTTPITHEFGYVGGNLTSMSVLDGIGYGFAYEQGELVEVTKAGTTVEKHSHPQSETVSYYPNSDNPLYTVSRTYDKYGRLTSVDSNLSFAYDIHPQFGADGTLVQTANNSSSRLAMTVDSKVGEISRYAYDTEGRLTQKTVTDEDDFAAKVSSETFAYDNFGRLETDTYTFGTPSETITTEVSYVSESDNRIQSHTHIVAKVPLGETAEVETVRVVTANTYDVQKRVILKTMSFYDKTFGRQFTYDKNRICGVVDTISNGVRLGSAYTFDTLGRITDDKHTFVGSATADDFKVYDYDEYGRLVQESNLGLDKVFVYEYNTIGNITNVKTYARADDGTASGTPTTKTYTYDTTHPDRLVTFGSKAITYNTNGEMTSYDGWDYSWSKGKLSRMEKTIGGSSTWAVKPSIPSVPSFPDSKAYTFAYNAVGQRVGMQYTYTQGSSSLSAMQVGELLSHSKTFTYDHAGRLMAESNSKTLYDIGTDHYLITYLYDGNTMIGMQYTANGTDNLYYFHRNLQGDVIGIYDTNGVLKVKYNYDAWGNCTVASGSDVFLAKANPIRYRGYYFDVDTGLYYLNARYYSPELRRFISPDDTAYLDPENVDGLNLYAYCCNDPVNYADPSGHDPKWYDIAAWIGAGLFVAAATVLTAGLAGAVIGGIAGGIIYGAAIGTVALGTIGAGVGAVVGMIYDAANGNNFGTSIWTWTKAGFGIGTISGAVIGGTVGGAAACSVTGLSNTSFWTGLGKSGDMIAGQVANSRGLITLGQTFGGKVAQFMTNRFGYAATKYIWASLSKTMASTVAMSQVVLFYGGFISKNSIFWLYELPALTKRGIEIIYTLLGG